MGDDGLFGPGSVTWRVHLEPVLWVGGFRALLLQSLHPRVMRGTYQNSALFDPAKAWSRFQRTVEFVGVRTFGSTAEVERAAARVRRLHAALRGYDPDTGYTFRVDHPDHLLWVHATEVDSYAHVARRAGLLDAEGVDVYLAESVRAARVIGLVDAPSSAGAMREYLESVRPELKLTDEAREAVGHLLTPQPTAPPRARVVIPTIAALSVATLPRWARRLYGLPGLPSTDVSATVTLRALQSATALLPDLPARVDAPARRSAARAGARISA